MVLYRVDAIKQQLDLQWSPTILAGNACPAFHNEGHCGRLIARRSMSGVEDGGKRQLVSHLDLSAKESAFPPDPATPSLPIY